MASSQAIKTLGKFRRLSVIERGIGATLPEAYKKFYKEWKLTEPTAVHYIPEEGKWKRNEITGEVIPIQNVPIPLKFPKEYDEQLWGGEAVIQGFQKRQERSRRVPHFWIPRLKRSVVYSEVLNKYMSTVVTNRAIDLIHANFGLDHYLLKTPACDLKSLLALTIKRLILKDLENGCPAYADNPEKQKEVYESYKQYLESYTSEEIDWYGYSFQQAVEKVRAEKEAQKPVPLKQLYRMQLIEKLKEAKIAEASEDIEVTSTSWMQKINPFTKKHET